MGIAGRIAGGRSLRRRRENGVVIGEPRLRGTAALQASTDHRCDEPMAFVGRCPGAGGRPLRRRREMVLMSATDGCEGTAALQANLTSLYHPEFTTRVRMAAVRARRMLEGLERS